MAIKMPVKDIEGAQVETIDLKESVFGVSMNEVVVHQALVWQRANARQGTASAKTRGEVAGTTRKPWRQKHTGRARVGTRMSPLWRHGGVVFGPSPRDFSQKMPRKMRRLAIRCLLSSKRENGELEVLRGLDLPDGKTRHFKGVLAALDVSGSVLVVTRESNENVIRSAKNLKGVKTLRASLLNTGDLLRYHHLIMTVDAVRVVEELWDGVSIDRKRIPEAAGPVPTEEPPPAEEAQPAVAEESPPAAVAIEEPAPVAVEEALPAEEAPAPRRAPARRRTAAREPEAAEADKADKPEKPAPARRRATARKPKAEATDEPDQPDAPKPARKTATRSRSARKKAQE